MIKVTDKHGDRLLRMAPALVRPALAEELEYGARVIADDAAKSIRAGGSSGRAHVPSAPGQPPNADTGDLDSSIRPIETIDLPGEVRSGVIADSDHALYQERGTSKMEARPFLEPAAERHRAEIFEALVGRFREMRGR
ncbi:hypothetical protein [Sphingomonas sp.]|uniref:hypothetical protein n=1 Tax=Sphingomonas sp. TaxID=28214 RepID=UPI003B3A8DDA